MSVVSINRLLFLFVDRSQQKEKEGGMHVFILKLVAIYNFLFWNYLSDNITYPYKFTSVRPRRGIRNV